MKKKIFSTLAMTALLSVVLSGCGGSEQSSTDNSGTTAKNDDVSLKVWVDPNSVDYYQTMIDQFESDHPDVNYTIEVVGSQVSKAQENLKKDPDAAGDIFAFPHDQLGQLVEAGVVYENTKYVDEVLDDNTKLAGEAASYEDKVYGYPYTVENMTLYYNKSKLTEEDIKTYETMVEKGKFGINFAESGTNYFTTPQFIANGALLYGKDGDDPQKTTFDNQESVNVLKWVAAQKENPNVVQATNDQLSLLESGDIDVIVNGPWAKESIEEVLGENMGIAAYPTADFGNGQKQMKAFLGVKMFGVNSNTQYPLEAMELANYITNKEAQKTLFEKRGIIPSNSELLESEAITSDALGSVIAQTATDENYTVVMPKLPEIVTFWPSIDAVINDAYKGNLNEKQMKEKLEILVEEVKSATD